MKRTGRDEDSFGKNYFAVVAATVKARHCKLIDFFGRKSRKKLRVLLSIEMFCNSDVTYVFYYYTYSIKYIYMYVDDVHGMLKLKLI